MNAWSSRILVAFAFSAASAMSFGAGESASEGARAETDGELPSFQQIDEDNSGFIEPSEAQDVAGLDMQNADADNDGKVSPEEFGYVKRNLMPGGEMNLPGTGKPNVPAEVETDSDQQ